MLISLEMFSETFQMYLSRRKRSGVGRTVIYTLVLSDIKIMLYLVSLGRIVFAMMDNTLHNLSLFFFFFLSPRDTIMDVISRLSPLAFLYGPAS